MIRLIKIEYSKLKNTKYFWVFSLLFVVVLIAVPVSSKSFIEYLIGQGENLAQYGITADSLPFFDFVDIWQNLTYVFKWPAILVAFIPVISMANEYRYGTAKQNIIDGLTRKELISSKILFIIAYSIVLGLITFLIGLFIGMAWSPVQGIDYVFMNAEFLLAFILYLIGYQIFCLLITLIIKKSGITILFLLFYFFALEAFSFAWIAYEWKLPENTSFLPLRGMANIVKNPFPKYFFQEVINHIRLRDVLVTLSHISVYTFLTYWIFQKKDIR